MITFTQAAQDYIAKICDRGDGTWRFLRIGVLGGGCSGFQYAMAHVNAPSAVDETFSVNGRAVVVVDQMSLMYLDDTEIDYINELSGSGFRFKNPNVKTTCGCGSSFSI